MTRLISLGTILLTGAFTPASDIAAELRQLDPRLATPEERAGLSRMLTDDVRARRQVWETRHRDAWAAIPARAGWEAFVHPRIERLKASLGTFPKESVPLDVRVTGTVVGDGFLIENVVYTSRPGWWVTANLYRPTPARPSMPGIILSHAHHTPKEHGELQDMGMMWARAGCIVLIPDHPGHGERRQHPFDDANAYSKPFRVSRQDYYFRYDLGVQLHLAGESLIGWMVYDLTRGVDLLRGQSGIDPSRIILLGAVAGGGDPAAVIAAIDSRITAVVPFNFGGPQPESRYPLPDDIETSFNYAGSGSWESTRNLRRSVADGFLPWVIVGSIAPRRLVYGHEFSWDRDRDPVWKRLRSVYGWYEAADRLAFTHGRGLLQGQPPEASHCTHIGPVHRENIHAAFRDWFGIVATEYRARVEPTKLRCLPARRPPPLADVLGTIADQHIAAAPTDRIALRKEWAKVLGTVNVTFPHARVGKSVTCGNATLQRVMLTTEPGIRVPLLLFTPSGYAQPPVVIGVGQGGKAAFLRERSAEVAGLLAAGVAVCLPDVRGTGETALGHDRGRTSSATSVSSSILMLGDTMVGGQLRDLRSVLSWLRSRDDLSGGSVVVWGDSFAAANPDEADFRIPRDDDAALPGSSEPVGGVLALLAGLYEDSVRAVYTRGGLTGFRDVLRSHLVTIPHDVVVPGALEAGDLSAVTKALAPRPVRQDLLVDGSNRRATADAGSPIAWIVAALK